MRRLENQMRSLLAAKRVGLLLAILMATPASWGANSKPTETLAGLRKEHEAAIEQKKNALESGMSESEAFARHNKTLAALGRRALTLAEANPDSPDAPEALAWIHTDLGRYAEDTADVFDASYDLMAERYLDRDAILPVCWLARRHALDTSHNEAFLRAAAEKSPNLKVRGLACFTLGRNQHELARVASALDDPITEKILERNLGPRRCQRVRALKPEVYKREAEAAYERTVKEFADHLCPIPSLPPLSKQAEGALFRLRNLEVGCTMPDVEGEDLDGHPLKLSEFRGKVVIITFWAAWCGPCLGLVPSEKELVERMKGRPFVLLGVNGDEDRAKAKAVSAKEGINWRSFWDKGPSGPIATKWNIARWPTIYVVDAEGKIRDDGILFFEAFHEKALDKAFERLVAEAEAKKP